MSHDRLNNLDFCLLENIQMLACTILAGFLKSVKHVK